MCSTCARFSNTHGSVLNVRTETFLTYTRGEGRGEGWFSALSFSLPFSLSNNDNDHSSRRALSVYTRL